MTAATDRRAPMPPHEASITNVTMLIMGPTVRILVDELVK